MDSDRNMLFVIALMMVFVYFIYHNSSKCEDFMDYDYQEVQVPAEVKEGVFMPVSAEDKPQQIDYERIEKDFLEKKKQQNQVQLLPKALDSSVSKLKDRNFLISGFHVGVDTRGSSLKNPNLQLRSEPSNPRADVSIWNNSTYEADLLRKRLE